MNLIITLLGAQTIPNVQFIKHIEHKLHKEDKAFKHLFISTEEMERKGVGQWIANVCGIENPQVIIVKHNDLFDIQTKLKNNVGTKYEMYYVNVTGGTKIMSMAVSDFFKEDTNARIYYIDGNSCWLNFPEKERWSADLSDNITLKDYVESYGFETGKGSSSGISPDFTRKFYKIFIEFSETELSTIKSIQQKRTNNELKKNNKIADIENLESFLSLIDFPLSDSNKEKLTLKEAEYLTGGWFEEYIYFRLKEENSSPVGKFFREEDLKLGMKLYKLDKNLQRIRDEKGNPVDNEFDVTFLYKTKFYAIECKTSIFNGEQNFINETIYKSVALKNKLGLFSNFSIFTLSSKGDTKNNVQEKHLKRAKDANIKVICREDIVNAPSISTLLGLK